MRDLVSNIGLVSVIAPAVLTATNTPSGVDLLGFGSAAIVISSGAIAGSGNFTAKLQESDDGTNFTDVVADDLHGDFPSALAENATVKIGYNGHKRYIRPILTKNSGTSIAASVVVVKGNATKRPVA